MPGETEIGISPVGPLVRPRGARETVVLHVRGGADPSEPWASSLGHAVRVAERVKAVVVCARYSPTFPAALEDVEAAYEYCRARGPVAVVGEELGAGLAAGLLVRLRDAGAALPLGAVLISALLDLALEASSLVLNAADPAFDLAELRRSAIRFAAGTAPTDPVLSPLRANLHGFPPIRLLAAGTNPLLDDSLAFAARAARSGVVVDLRVCQDSADLSAQIASTVAEFVDEHALALTAPARESMWSS